MMRHLFLTLRSCYKVLLLSSVANKLSLLLLKVYYILYMISLVCNTSLICLFFLCHVHLPFICYVLCLNENSLMHLNN